MFTPAPSDRARRSYFATPVSPFVAFSPQRSSLRAATTKSPKARTTPFTPRLWKSKLSLSHITDPPSSPVVPTNQLQELGIHFSSGENAPDDLADIDEDVDIIARQQLHSARERCSELRGRIEDSKRRLGLTKALVETQEQYISDASAELGRVEDEIGQWRVLLHDQSAAPAPITMDNPLELDDSIEMEGSIEQDEDDAEGAEEGEDDAEGEEEGEDDAEAGEQVENDA
ncbi:hypothetical protein SISNIDRAFT_490118 [Sistotremastrum niveocremeum HHB9708]|uniref:Uncharacterized protein n=2 Tax=Sistotremastraceae TaxID=3402574 RepID=A0A164PAH1_9AGAM|nr:hypothetical protein SISNIDRAFT_490118 [Sistotremastrum niveocremeum HHB9708]KZT33065.1 hypothetical protein SISSUDRAFT_1066445 [Sistotremastrum suecicum HHB10207 ss-3]